jgi:hypothetical protein
MNQTNFEFSSNAVFLRNRELTLHYKKLDEIQSRKNLFVTGNLRLTQPSFKTKKKMNIVLQRKFQVEMDNEYLTNKIAFMNSIDPAPKNMAVLKNSKSQETIRHLQITEAYRKLKEKSLNEENTNIMKRLKFSTDPVMDFTKFEDGYRQHLKLKKLIRKVGNDFNKVYKEKNEFLPKVNTSFKPSLYKSSRRNMSMDGAQFKKPLINNYGFH